MATLSLPSRLDPQVSDFLETQKETVFQIAEAFGSPSHIVFPQLLSENSARFREVFLQHGLPESSVHFASKVNKGESFLEEASKDGIGVDVSSIEELRSALAHGVLGERISVSGPAKKERLMALAAQHNSTISIDSVNELEALIVLLQKIETPPASLVIRISDLNQKYSRFGVTSHDLPSMIAKIQPQSTRMILKGFHFHLSGYSTDERVTALQAAIQELQNARSLGYACDTINIGGGFAVRYIDAENWKKFGSEKHVGNFAGSKEIESFYPYGNELNGAQQLNAILSAQTDTHARISDVLKKEGIRLAIEPGRSLVDQAGITCMQVKGVKPTSDGTYIIEVDANINHLSEQWFGSEFCVDPIHLRKNSGDPGTAIEAAVGGNTCLEIDMLSWRKIGFTSTPRAGDLLVYANTAGYQMDSNESAFHRLPIPEKIAAYRKQGKWKWKKDSEYSFLDPM